MSAYRVPQRAERSAGGSDSSDDDDDDDDDDDSPSSKLRCRARTAPTARTETGGAAQRGRRRNNVWGSVLQAGGILYRLSLTVVYRALDLKFNQISNRLDQRLTSYKYHV